ncbi:DNA polymerase III subunit gamma/tau [Desertibaculum subflavum]|uniref:DNA polymerase III subunit gamma/tau n=1 Tax=Desertibaculum subflavum TaxID=2268458 RepID=UPI000E66B0D1
MNEPAAYRVLARKHRPADFSSLIGQDALVRTLTNAFESGRLAHAFILTGVRGVGKTTTARIIARALNCVGPDGTGGPTINPCGICEPCRAIAEDRHVDVIEMDAASRTGIGDIREIIEAVRYAPASARYKVYIIDEVHMLSTAAFNGLLKTLEEPPPHVKFVFATTEIRKVPVTVLSRCQRFDLRRVEAERLVAHLGNIAKAEGVTVAPEALALIARAAEGSVRDALSLLDQAIAHGNGAVEAEAVRDMLGLADRGQVLDLFEAIMRGDVPEALRLYGQQHEAGTDPEAVVRDLLELTHWLTRLRIVPALADDPSVPEAERGRGRAMAQKLGMAVLQRAWQMLLKGLGEVQRAPRPAAAAEMLILRLAHVAELPPPGDLVAALTQGAAAAPAAAPAAMPAGRPAPALPSRPMAKAVGESAPSAPRAAPAASPAPAEAKLPSSLREIVELVAARGDSRLRAEIVLYVRPVRIDAGHVEFSTAPGAPPDLANRLQLKLREWTARPWAVVVSTQPGEPSIDESEKAAKAAARAEVERHPLVQAVFAAFPGAAIQTVTPPAPAADPVETEEEAPAEPTEAED